MRVAILRYTLQMVDDRVFYKDRLVCGTNIGAMGMVLMTESGGYHPWALRDGGGTVPFGPWWLAALLAP